VASYERLYNRSGQLIMAPVCVCVHCITQSHSLQGSAPSSSVLLTDTSRHVSRTSSQSQGKELLREARARAGHDRRTAWTDDNNIAFGVHGGLYGVLLRKANFWHVTPCRLIFCRFLETFIVHVKKSKWSALACLSLKTKTRPSRHDVTPQKPLSP